RLHRLRWIGAQEHAEIEVAAGDSNNHDAYQRTACAAVPLRVEGLVLDHASPPVEMGTTLLPGNALVARELFGLGQFLSAYTSATSGAAFGICRQRGQHGIGPDRAEDGHGRR